MHVILRVYQGGIFVLARLLGLLPVTAERSQAHPNARRSKLMVAYSLLLVCFGSATCVLQTSNALQPHQSSRDHAFRELMLAFATTFQIVVPLLKADQYADVINQYAELVRNTDDKYGSGLPDPFTTVIKVLCCSTVFLYVVPESLIVLWMFVEGRYSDWAPMAIYFSSKFSTHIQDTQLMIMVANLRARVQSLNGVLKGLADKGDAPFWTKSSRRARMLDSIQETRRQHLMIAQLARCIETAYGPQLLVSLAIFFVDAFFTLYYLVLRDVYHFHWDASEMFYSVVLTYWTIITFVEITTVVRVCDGAAEELEAFWLQTQHLPVRYRAGQYFQMNNKLIYKMARLMASYLLWATQMRVHQVAPSAGQQ